MGHVLFLERRQMMSSSATSSLLWLADSSAFESSWVSETFAAAGRLEFAVQPALDLWGSEMRSNALGQLASVSSVLGVTVFDSSFCEAVLDLTGWLASQGPHLLHGQEALVSTGVTFGACLGFVHTFPGIV